MKTVKYLLFLSLIAAAASKPVDEQRPDSSVNMSSSRNLEGNIPETATNLDLKGRQDEQIRSDPQTSTNTELSIGREPIRSDSQLTGSTKGSSTGEPFEEKNALPTTPSRAEENELPPDSQPTDDLPTTLPASSLEKNLPTSTEKSLPTSPELKKEKAGAGQDLWRNLEKGSSPKSRPDLFEKKPSALPDARQDIPSKPELEDSLPKSRPDSLDKKPSGLPDSKQDIPSNQEPASVDEQSGQVDEEEPRLMIITFRDVPELHQRPPQMPLVPPFRTRNPTFFGPPHLIGPVPRIPVILPNPLLRHRFQDYDYDSDSSDEESDDRRYPFLRQPWRPLSPMINPRPVFDDIRQAPPFLGRGSRLMKRDVSQQQSDPQVMENQAKVEENPPGQGDEISKKTGDIKQGSSEGENLRDNNPVGDGTDVVTLITGTIVSVSQEDPLQPIQDPVSSLGLQSGDNEPVMITLIIPKEGVGEGVEFEQREEDREIDSGSDQLSASRVKGDDENLNEEHLRQGHEKNPFKQLKPYEGEVKFKFGKDLAKMKFKFPEGQGHYEVRDGRGLTVRSEFNVDDKGNFKLLDSKQTHDDKSRQKKFSFSAGNVNLDLQLDPFER
jgi:hypothetical protein